MADPDKTTQWNRSDSSSRRSRTTRITRRFSATFHTYRVHRSFRSIERRFFENSALVNSQKALLVKLFRLGRNSGVTGAFVGFCERRAVGAAAPQ